MRRSIGGLPLWAWVAALGAVVGGAVLVKRRQSGSAAGATSPAVQQPFSAQQEMQDFQVFQALTSAQQSSDLGFVSQMLAMFGAGGGTAATGAAPGSGGGGSSSTGIPLPAPPTTSSPAPPTGGTQVPITPINPSVTTTVQTPTPTVPGQPTDYAQVPTIAQQVTDLATGVPVYWESAPGVFNRVSPEHPAPLGAAIYVQGPT